MAGVRKTMKNTSAFHLGTFPIHVPTFRLEKNQCPSNFKRKNSCNLDDNQSNLCDVSLMSRMFLLVENLIFLFKQKRKGQGQKFTENTPSVDPANIKLSVMKMQKMLGELIEGKG